MSKFRILITGAPNENIVQNHLNIACIALLLKMGNYTILGGGGFENPRRGRQAKKFNNNCF